LTLTICLSDWKTSSNKSAVAYSPHSEKACCRLPFLTLSLMSVYLCLRVAGRGRACECGWRQWWNCVGGFDESDTSTDL
jgi:hypothetical protein